MLIRVPLLAVQKALYARLAGDLAPVPVHAYVPQTGPYPFVTIHDFTLGEESTKGAGIGGVTYAIGIASKEQGVIETQQIIDKIVRAVSRAPLDLEDGWSHRNLSLEFCESFPQSGESEVIQVTELRYRFVIQDSQVQ